MHPFQSIIVNCTISEVHDLQGTCQCRQAQEKGRSLHSSLVCSATLEQRISRAKREEGREGVLREREREGEREREREREKSM